MKPENRRTCWIWMLTLLALLAGGLSLAPAAETAPQQTAYVTVADGEGALALVREPVPLTDADGDGAITVNDVLLLAHDSAYPGGAAAGYASSVGEYGLKLDRLWGVENGGGYGYYVNHASAMSLTDPVSAGDEVVAFVYTDTDGFSDTYCYFNASSLGLDAPGEVTLTLMAAGWDAEYQPVALPVEGAVILVNGEPTALRTDARGQVTLTLTAGEFLISASSDTQVLVPPVCQVRVAGIAGTGEPGTDDAGALPDGTGAAGGTDRTLLYAMAAFAGVVLLAAPADGLLRRRKER